ncbi:TPA: hypothetical protein ACIN9K_001314 [Streptococcus agalactiae]|nr:hypothetical protein [Streptococcus agalactiae]HEN9347536.1 hypothetical protein [Streptococcus agalactiae]HEO2002334.1 hypothetical protein [Streptococcus agalactiae]HEO3105202.1 hypothetical protein [Streptococcus agalactiae]HEO3835144.1 hypothetical protein [Streptococcus agalactiae]
MPEIISVDYFQLPLESLENNLDFLQSLYSENRFDDMDNAKKLIKNMRKLLRF